MNNNIKKGEQGGKGVKGLWVCMSTRLGGDVSRGGSAGVMEEPE